MTSQDEEKRSAEMTELLEAVAKSYGYDFTEYSDASLRRRMGARSRQGGADGSRSSSSRQSTP